MENTTPKILIDSTAWPGLNMIERQLIVFHEMGHCVLHLEHKDAKPAIMNSIIVSDVAFAKNQRKLLDDFFRQEVVEN